MNTRDREQTMALTYQAICQGERPWVALGNFMNEWFDYAKEQRAQLIADPLTLPEEPDTDALHWAAFCAASVEWLCRRYEVLCPSWVYNSAYSLPEPWFDSPGAHKPQVRERILLQTPEPFVRRNVFCGNRMFANKYEFAEQYQQHVSTMSTASSTLSGMPIAGSSSPMFAWQEKATQATSFPDSSSMPPARSYPLLSQCASLLSVKHTLEEPVMMLQALYPTPGALYNVETT